MTKPELPKTYDRLIVVGVDWENDFARPDGALSVPNAEQVIPAFNRVSQWARQCGGLVVLTADWHPAKTSHFDKWPPHCIADTYGAEFHADLEVDPRDIILRKGMRKDEDAYSGFDAVGPPRGDHKPVTLESLMHPYKESVAIAIGGLATDYCVKATGLDAVHKAKQIPAHEGEVDVFIIEDAIAGVNVKPGDSAAATTEMKTADVIFVTSEDIINNKVFRLNR